jgi:hypothetical protein
MLLVVVDFVPTSSATAERSMFWSV